MYFFFFFSRGISGNSHRLNQRIVNINNEISGPKEADVWGEAFLMSPFALVNSDSLPAVGKERTNKTESPSCFWSFP